MKTRITLKDYITANRKVSREMEIAEHTHTIPHHNIHKSKKLYNRKAYKTGRNDLSFFIRKN